MITLIIQAYWRPNGLQAPEEELVTIADVGLPAGMPIPTRHDRWDHMGIPCDIGDVKTEWVLPRMGPVRCVLTMTIYPKGMIGSNRGDRWWEVVPAAPTLPLVAGPFPPVSEQPLVLRNLI